MRVILASAVLLCSLANANEFEGIYLEVPDKNTAKINEHVKAKTGEDISYKAVHVSADTVSYFWGREPMYSIPYKIYGKTLVAYPGKSTLVLFMESNDTLITTGFRYVRDVPTNKP